MPDSDASNPVPEPDPAAESSFAWFVARAGSHGEDDFEAWVAQHSGQEDELRRLYAAWLVDPTRTQEASFFHRGGATEPSPQPVTEAIGPGAQVGDFKLVRELGRGGMGAVWEAEQGSLSRRVALKLLLPERGGARAIEFFEREARAGGRLSHPGIISVYASGQDQGMHWLAMELVDGGCTLAHFVEDMRQLEELPPEYFQQVAGFLAEIADAVGAAHEAGVIHRDLKPLNVLIGKDDVPKVGDFGLARVVDELSLSMTGDLAGTYFYMSPEQVMARRMGIDHRSDIFSLGVMVYELLTLVRPFQGDTTHQIAEQIVLHEPQDPRQIRSRVPSDLAVICAKAMEKKPADRYASMAELAADLRRYLGDEPILAKSPGVVRRCVKWTRRNPAKSAVGVIAAAALAVVFALWQRSEQARQDAVDARRATEDQRDRAQSAQRQTATALAQVEEEKRATEAALESANQERAKAVAAQQVASEQRSLAEQRVAGMERVSQFQANQLSNVDAQVMGAMIRSEMLQRASAGGDAAALGAVQAELAAGLGGVNFTELALAVLNEHVFDRALRELEAFEDQPLLQARLQQAVASTLRTLGLLDQARSPQRQALDIYQRELGGEARATLRSMHALGDLLMQLGELEAAASHLSGLLETCRRVFAGDSEELTLGVIFTLANVRSSQGDSAAAVRLCQEVVAGYRRLLGAEAPETLGAISGLASFLHYDRKLEQSEAAAREATDGFRRLRGDDDPDTLVAINNLAGVLKAQGRLEPAEDLLRGSVERMRRSLGGVHPATLTGIQNLATLCIQRGKLVEAERLFSDALAGSRRALGDTNPETLSLMGGLGVVLHRLGRLEESEKWTRAAVQGKRLRLGPGHPSLVIALENLAMLLLHREEFPESEKLLRDVVAQRRRALGEDDWETLSVTLDLARALLGQGKLDEAQRLAERVAASSSGPLQAECKKFLESLREARKKGGR